jgi:hypothetical protein
MDFSHYYHTKTKQSVDEDQAAIIAGFREIIKSGARPNFRLVNYYKGLPISYPATIVDLEHGTLELDVHQQQSVAIDLTRRVFIKCDYFDSSILAEVQSVDVRRKTAALKNFAFVEIMAERRDSLRLELDPQTDAEISGDALKLPGKLFNISLGGFSISTEERCPLGKGAEVRLRIKIPNLLQNTVTGIETTACHVETITNGYGDICRFSFQPDPPSEAAISRFIFQRQVEIIREIKDAI